MDGNAVIPQRASSWSPLEADLDIDIALIHIIEIVEDQIALRFVQTDDGLRHSPVDI